MTLTGNHIGTLIKPHGYKGDMILRGKPLFLENLEPGTPLFIEIDELRVPFFIEELSLDTSSEKCIIKLEFINSNEDGRKYAGCQVYEDARSAKTISGNNSDTSGNSKSNNASSAENTSANQAQGNITLHIAEYIGYTAVDTNTGAELEITNYIDSPHNPLLILMHNKKEILLPLNADYIIETDTKNKTLRVSFPDGLL